MRYSRILPHPIPLIRLYKSERGFNKSKKVSERKRRKPRTDLEDWESQKDQPQRTSQIPQTMGSPQMMIRSRNEAIPMTLRQISEWTRDRQKNLPLRRKLIARSSLPKADALIVNNKAIKQDIARRVRSLPNPLIRLNDLSWGIPHSSL